MRTPLYECHTRLKARMTDFHGWEMPLQYRSIMEEHAAVRTRAGLFDLSHMGRLFLDGPDREKLAQKLFTADVPSLSVGQAKYCFLLNEHGGVIDDVILYRDEQALLIVCNASNRQAVVEHVKKHAAGFQADLHDRTRELAMIAVQGPESEAFLDRTFDLKLQDLKYYRFRKSRILEKEAILARTGYTGEDGFELIVPASSAGQVWDCLVAAGRDRSIIPAGLGARDTLRMEAGMPLYGQELDADTSPLEAGLDFAVQMNNREFIGRSALLERKPARRLIGFELDGRRIARHGMDVRRGEEKVGVVTSGTFSPTLQKSIGMCFVKPEYAEPGAALEVDLRGKRESIRLTALPFYNRKRKSHDRPIA